MIDDDLPRHLAGWFSAAVPRVIHGVPMRAVSIDTPGKARLVDVDTPEPRAGEVRVRVRRVGLCGSDLSTFLGKNPMVSYPRVPGHEVAATIDAMGAGVPPEWKVGTNVTFTPYTACGTCASCRAQRKNACRNNQTMG